MKILLLGLSDVCRLYLSIISDVFDASHLRRNVNILIVLEPDVCVGEIEQPSDPLTSQLVLLFSQ